FVLLAVSAPARAYIWPNKPLDDLEGFRWNQIGYHASPFVEGEINPCDFYFVGPNYGGRSNVADWIRVAYHDMATHNVEDGTGGLDGSIHLKEEQARAEHPLTHRTVADTTLLRSSTGHSALPSSTTMSLSQHISSGGPEINFRGGRVDAKVPNNPGVPQPQDLLESHIASFKRQGFTPTEMIGLVACGHTFGGVQGATFPDIVPEKNDPTNIQSNQLFDSTGFTFDNKIATEYIDGTTTNPLVVGHNETTNSDKRIFASDSNVTMHAFADSPEFFSKTCAELFARMLDTVPRGVQLTEVIKPLGVKPQDVALEYNLDGTLTLSGEVRFWNMTENAKRVVQMRWADREGKTADGNSSALGHTPEMVTTALGGKRTAVWYNVPAGVMLDAARGPSKFWYTADGVVHDQHGLGFPIQDAVMWSASTCAVSNDTVRSDLKPTRVWLQHDGLDFLTLLPKTETRDVPAPEAPGSGPYAIWSLELHSQAGWFPGAEIDGKTL
ncbi:hypothetical protein AURDEDRAFT_35480, partial [Auricularia subglabra TFB-10046 SS5]